MSVPTYFKQDCPVCGRGLQIRVEYQGRTVKCRHCHGAFEACDPASGQEPSDDSGLALLRRAEDLITAADSRIVRSVRSHPSASRSATG
jgi:hypothetical protein